MKKIISLLVILALTIIGTAVYFVFFNNTFLVNSMPKQINSENETQSIGGTKVVAIGDSLTAGYGLNISESYPAQLEKALREKSKDVEVVNMGVSGETTAGLLERVDFIKKQTRT
jgi:lysophospholipase L1-like esterase